MRASLFLILIVSSLHGFSQSPPPEDEIPFNKVLFFIGNPEKEYRDPHLYFQYTGIPENLLGEIAKLHGASNLGYNTKLGCYELVYVSEPHWYYMSYRVRIQYGDDGLYRV